MGVNRLVGGALHHGELQPSPGMALHGGKRCMPQDLLCTYCVPLAFMNPFYT